MKTFGKLSIESKYEYFEESTQERINSIACFEYNGIRYFKPEYIDQEYLESCSESEQEDYRKICQMILEGNPFAMDASLDEDVAANNVDFVFILAYIKELYPNYYYSFGFETNLMFRYEFVTTAMDISSKYAQLMNQGYNEIEVRELIENELKDYVLNEYLVGINDEQFETVSF